MKMATEQATFGTIEVQDGIELEVAEDPEDSTTYAVGGTVSVEETVSTGDYESYKPYASLRVQFRPVIRLVSDQHRQAVRQKLLHAHRDIHDEVQQMIDNRLSEPGFENWEATAEQLSDDEDGQ
jgi:hypothetical protein